LKIFWQGGDKNFVDFLFANRGLLLMKNQTWKCFNSSIEVEITGLPAAKYSKSFMG